MNYLSSYRKCQLSDDPDIIYNFWVHSTSNCRTYHWRCSEQCKRVYIQDFVVLPWTSFLQDAGHASNCWRKLQGGNVPKWTWYKLDVLYLHCCIITITMLNLHTSQERCSLQKLYTPLHRGSPKGFCSYRHFQLKRSMVFESFWCEIQYSIYCSLWPFIFNYPIPFVHFDQGCIFPSIVGNFNIIYPHYTSYMKSEIQKFKLKRKESLIWTKISVTLLVTFLLFTNWVKLSLIAFLFVI